MSDDAPRALCGEDDMTKKKPKPPDPLDKTTRVRPVECRTPSARLAWLAGSSTLLVLSITASFALFSVPDKGRPWVAAGILAGGTAALGIYTGFRILADRSLSAPADTSGTIGICPDPECGRELRSYPPGTRFVPVELLQMGMKFRIPDLHGGYGRCCLRGKPAIYQVVANTANEFGQIWEKHALRCVACGEETPFAHTTIQTVEVVP